MSVKSFISGIILGNCTLHLCLHKTFEPICQAVESEQIFNVICNDYIEHEFESRKFLKTEKIGVKQLDCL